MKVSAIISTYNSQRYIRKCIEDLLSQSIASDIEIIVVNSGSQQNESEIVQAYMKKFSNIFLIETKRETIYSAWNTGLSIASGEYVSNANTDDKHDRRFFELVTQELDKNKDKILCYTDFELFKEQDGNVLRRGTSIRKSYSRSRLLQINYVGPQPVWRRSVHEEFGFFNEKFVVAGDYEFWLRISQKYDFCYLNKPLGKYLFRRDSLERRDGRVLCEKETQIVKNMYKFGISYEQACKL